MPAVVEAVEREPRRMLVLLLLPLLLSSALEKHVYGVVRDEEKHAAARQDRLRVDSNPWEIKHIRPSNAVSGVLPHQLTGSDRLPEKLDTAARVDQCQDIISAYHNSHFLVWEKHVGESRGREHDTPCSFLL